MALSELPILPEEAQTLGPPLAVYRPTRALLVGLGVCAVVIVGGLVLAVAAVWSMLQPGPIPQKSLEGMQAGVGAGLGLMVMGACLAIAALRAGKRRVVVCQDGLVLVKPRGCTIVRWDEIVEFYRAETRLMFAGFHLNTSRTFAIVTTAGKRTEITSFFRDTGTLGDTIERQVLTRLLPAALAALEAGETVTFGPIGVSRQGLWRAGGHVLPWEALDSVQIASGWLRVRQAGAWFNWFSLMSGAVPNVLLFLALVNKMCKEPQSGEGVDNR